jgi:hypothetical protein
MWVRVGVFVLVALGVLAMLAVAVLAQDQSRYFLTTQPGETYNLLRCRPAATIDCAQRANWTLVSGALTPAQIPVTVTHPTGKSEYSWEACIPGGACVWRLWDRVLHDSALVPSSLGVIQIGSKIRVTQEVAVRAAPGGQALGLQPVGTTGVVAAGPQSGIWGNTWWQINFSSGCCHGWVTVDHLQVVP